MAAATQDPDIRLYAKAKADRAKWDGVLADAYRYCDTQGPNPRAATATGQDKGSKKGKDVYDSTAPTALIERAAATINDLFPASTQWLRPHPDLGDESKGGGKDAEEYVAGAFDRAQRAFDESNFLVEVYMAIRDAFISTGALRLDFGKPERPFAFEALPVSQICPVEAIDGIIRTNFRRLDVLGRDLDARYPGAKLPEETARQVKNKPEEAVRVVEAEVHDWQASRSRFKVFLDKDTGSGTVAKKPIFEELVEVQRTAVFRADKKPGETMGRGPALAVMPAIKTANKVVELVLKNASIAVTGIWQADDDGVLNPATIKLAPGTIIPKAVGSAGLTPLEAPGKFDIAQLVLRDLREEVRRIIYGPALPPVDKGVRTALEMSLRRADQQRVEGPQLRRLLSEMFLTTVRRAFFILTHPSMAGSPFYIMPMTGENGAADQMRTVDFLMDALESPEERFKREADSNNQLNALATIGQVFGPEALGLVEVPDFITDFLKDHGFPAELIKDAKTLKAEQKRNAALKAAQVLAQAAGNQGSDTPSSLLSTEAKGNA